MNVMKHGNSKTLVFSVAIVSLLFFVVCVSSLVVWYEPSYDSNLDGAWSPIWSSDGNHIAFECMFLNLSDLPNYDEGSYLGLRDICVLDRNSNKLVRLTTDRSPSSSPSWSFDGMRLAWLKGNDILVIWDISTGDFTSFRSPNPFQHTNGYLDWSQDDRRVFVQGDGTVFDVENEVFIPLAQPQKDLHVCCFTWSPHGDYLAYKQLKFEDTYGYHWQVVIMKNDETVIISELETNLDDPYLQWSPDGSTLAWQAETGGYRKYLLALSYMQTRKTVFLRIDEGYIGFGGIGWSPSGDQIAIRLGDELEILNPQPDAIPSSLTIIEPQSISLHGSSFGGLSWSPDGEMIAYESDWQEGSRIWLLQLDGLTNVPLYDE